MYEVKIINAVGTCENTLIKKMLQKGDIAFKKLSELVDTEIEVNGYAHYIGINKDEQKGTTTETEYLLVATNQGYIRTGSKVFQTSFLDYADIVNHFTIREIKCKVGTTYKPEPIL